MFEKIRNRPAPLRHMYVERPAYIITEKELDALGAIVVEAFQRGVEQGQREAKAREWGEICPRCGSGLVNGEHIANYPPCNGEDEKVKSADRFVWRKEDGPLLQVCSECGRDLHGYRGPLCRYCDGTAD